MVKNNFIFYNCLFIVNNKKLSKSKDLKYNWLHNQCISNQKNKFVTILYFLYERNEGYTKIKCWILSTIC